MKAADEEPASRQLKAEAEALKAPVLIASGAPAE